MITLKMFSSEKKKHVNQLLPQVADIEQKVQRGKAWSRETLDDFLAKEHNHLLLAISDEQSKPVVAFCLYQTIFENAEILRMGTHPKYHRKGIAQSVLKKLFQKLQKKEVESLMLEVREDNNPAIRLYEKSGFHQIDSRKGYYSRKNKPPIDALILKKDLMSQCGVI